MKKLKNGHTKNCAQYLMKKKFKIFKFKQVIQINLPIGLTLMSGSF